MKVCTRRDWPPSQQLLSGVIDIADSSDDDAERGQPKELPPAKRLCSGSGVAAAGGSSSSTSRPSSSSRSYAGPVYLNQLLEGPASVPGGQELTLQSIFEAHPRMAAGEPLPLKEVLLVNFMIDLGWLLDECPSLQSVPELTVLHGDDAHGCARAVALRKSRGLETRLHSPPLPLQWGTHHSKMAVLFFDSCVRVCVRTCNDLYTDFHCKSQALYLQDFPTSASAPRGDDAFGLDFRQHLKAYLSKCGGFAHSKLDGYDFSTATVALVGSVPGYHTGRESERWGHMRLRRLLEAHAEVPAAGSTCDELVCQFSSLGSLTPQWFKDFRASLGSSKPRRGAGGIAQMKGPDLPTSLVVPTMEQVRDCGEGWVAGASVPIRKSNLKEWLTPHWRKWGTPQMQELSEQGRRAAHAMPHVKSYCRWLRVNGSSSSSAAPPLLLWLFVGSHNLSKAAWGELQKGGQQLCIRSYELGVLVLPSRLGALERDPERPDGYFWRFRDLSAAPLEACGGRTPMLLPANSPRDTDGFQLEVFQQNSNVQIFPVACPTAVPPAEPPSASNPPWAVDREDAARWGLDRFGTHAGERARQFYGHKAAPRRA
mmetsp:Transcript_6064/g.13427  ORF Transcript_6064/g.13427 Transcript_6064/m.13427 type:complete len:596 (-) Transcript_6064:25-1812(-)